MFSNTNNDIQIIILAAGKGSRMKSNLPKPMHKIRDRTMIEIVIGHATKISSNITIVYSHIMKPYLDSLLPSSPYKLVLQDEPLGTGHAVYSAIDAIETTTPTIVLYADNPFIDDNMITAMLHEFATTASDIMVMAFERFDPKGYGRIVMDEKRYVKKIVECKDANTQEKAIILCNSGIILFNSEVLKESLLDLMSHHISARGEYYLTTLIEIAYNKGYKTGYFTTSGLVPLGVNTQKELRAAQEVDVKCVKAIKNLNLDC